MIYILLLSIFLNTLGCQSFPNHDLPRSIALQMSRMVGGMIKCTCQDTYELTSALAFHVLPNTIDFSTVFSKFDVSGQAAVLGTILAMLTLFSLLSVWAHYWDRKGLVQVSDKTGLQVLLLLSSCP